MIRGEAGPAGPTVRFRFIEEDLGAIIDTRPYDELEADMKFLCENYALERIADTGPQPAAVIVSISDRPVPFGAPSPEARQVFEAYRPENGSCIWEGF
ncbi:MAG: acetolactate synthase [Alphaproteobacteria bacterium]|nr:MAG: acetolactate synthase [Alphaproteobacteria bacterium]